MGILDAADAERIRSNHAALARATDDGDYDALTYHLAEGVVLHSAMGGQRYVGRAEVIAYLAEREARVRHLYCNLEVTDGAGELAQVTSDVLVLAMPGLTVATVARHEDEWQRSDGHWLLLTRRSQLTN